MTQQHICLLVVRCPLTTTIFWLINIYIFCVIIVKVNSKTLEEQKQAQYKQDTLSTKNYSLMSKNVTEHLPVFITASSPFLASTSDPNYNFIHEFTPSDDSNSVNIDTVDNHHVFISPIRNRKPLNNERSNSDQKLLNQDNDEKYNLFTLNDEKVSFK